MPPTCESRMDPESRSTRFDPGRNHQNARIELCFSPKQSSLQNDRPLWVCLFVKFILRLPFGVCSKGLQEDNHQHYGSSIHTHTQTISFTHPEVFPSNFPSGSLKVPGWPLWRAIPARAKLPAKAMRSLVRKESFQMLK